MPGSCMSPSRSIFFQEAPHNDTTFSHQNDPSYLYYDSIDSRQYDILLGLTSSSPIALDDFAGHFSGTDRWLIPFQSKDKV